MNQGTRGTGPIVGLVVADIWTFESELPLRNVDLTGYSVEATDGKIGKVDDATFEVGGSYLIVDAGPWIFGNKKVILPAGIVERVDEKTETVFVNRPKEEIANAPEYDEERGHREQEYRQRLGSYYGGLRD
jgi:PRC-barrel domain